jgi:N-methylhydantoinase B
MVALSLPDPRAGRRHVTVVEPMIGGGGGRPGQDGIDGCDAALGFLKTTPAESLEAEVPIVVRRFHLIPESAGPGRFRGGFGIRLDFQVFQPEGLVTARGMERLRFQPWGMNGGAPGQCGAVVLNPGTPGERRLPKIDVLALEPGDVLSVRSPGGGGYGDPFERPAEAVRDDVRAGLLTAGHALEGYGVVLSGDEVDEEATKALRRPRLTAGPRAGFDFGPARGEHERVWTEAVYERLIGILMSLPTSYRPYVRRSLYRRVQAEAAGRPVTPGDVDRLWHDLRRTIRIE